MPRSATALQGIVRLVEEAQGSKAPIQAYADYVSARFIPAVLAIAVLATAGWALGVATGTVPEEWYRGDGGGPVVFCLLFGVAVLVIACRKSSPFSLSLAA